MLYMVHRTYNEETFLPRNILDKHTHISLIYIYIFLEFSSTTDRMNQANRMHSNVCNASHATCLTPFLNYVEDYVEIIPAQGIV